MKRNPTQRRLLANITNTPKLRNIIVEVSGKPTPRARPARARFARISHIRKLAKSFYIKLKNKPD